MVRRSNHSRSDHTWAVLLSHQHFLFASNTKTTASSKRNIMRKAQHRPVPVQCPYSARTVPVQCPVQKTTVPGFSRPPTKRIQGSASLESRMRRALWVFLPGTVRALYGHCTGTVRALRGVAGYQPNLSYKGAVFRVRADVC